MAELGLSKSYWGFDPRGLPGCKIWLDAGDTNTITRSGNNVLTIKNKAFYSDVSATPGTTQATTGSLTLNGLNLISIGNDVSLLIPTNMTFESVNRSVFLVAQVDASAVTGNLRAYPFLLGTTSGASAVFYIGNDNGIQFGRAGANISFVGYNASWGSNVFNSSFLLNANNSIPANDRGIFLNGSSLALGNDASTNLFSTGAATQTIAASTTSRADWRLGEMLLYDQILTRSQRQQIEGYLAGRWGLTSKLPVSHPYKIVPPFAATFQPLDIQGCILWLDAADRSNVILNGSTVSQWSDKSSFSNHAIQATGSNQPTYVNSVQNGLPVIRFTSNVTTPTTFFNNTTMAFPATPYAIFVVARGDAGKPSSTGFLYAFKSNSSAEGTFARVLAYSGANAFGIGIGASQSTGVSRSTWSVVSLLDRSTVAIPYVNTVNPPSTTITPSTTSATTGYVVGESSSTGQNWNGDIAEIIVYNRDICGMDQQQVEGYLAKKWGLTVPSTFTYSSNRPGPTASPFEPLSINNLRLWLDGTDVCGNKSAPADGTNMTVWIDKSGSNNHLTRSTGAGFPTYSLSTSAVKFGGATSMLTSNVTSAPMTMFFVYKNYNGGGPMFSTNNIPTVDGMWPNNGWDLPERNRFTVARQDGNNFSFWYIQFNTPFPLNRTCMITVQYGGTAAGSSMAGYLDASQIFTSTTLGTMTRSFFRLALRQSTTDYLTADYNEVMYYAAILPVAERQAVEGYLAWKWGLVPYLQSNHPYKTVSP